MLDIVIGNSNSFGILQSISDSKKENIGNQNHVLRKTKRKDASENFGLIYATVLLYLWVS